MSTHTPAPMRRDAALILDVRTAAEFDAGHVPRAKNIPVDELQRRLSELGPRERPILVYCRSGNRSATAAATLRSAGFQHVDDVGAMSNVTR